MIERFEELLFLAGYIVREEYDEPSFKKISVKSYRLTEGFPRIQLSSIPAGIEKVSYSLNLEPCAAFEGKPKWWEEQS